VISELLRPAEAGASDLIRATSVRDSNNPRESQSELKEYFSATLFTSRRNKRVISPEELSSETLLSTRSRATISCSKRPAVPGKTYLAMANGRCRADDKSVTGWCDAAAVEAC